MRKVIVATDFSEVAENALTYAAKAAAKRQLEIVLFTLQNVSIHALNARLSTGAMDAHMLHKKEQLAGKAAHVSAAYGIPVTPYFATGDFFNEIEQCIEATGADMLVMGMAEKTMEQDLLGNTTTAAIHRLRIPVLSIPFKASYEGIHTIVFACDITRGVHRQVLEKVRNMAVQFGAVVEIFNVTNVVNALSRDNKENISRSMEGVAYYYNEVPSADVITAIKEEVNAKKADLLIMVPYRYGFWSALVHKSKTRVMASGGEVPLLTIQL